MMLRRAITSPSIRLSIRHYSSSSAKPPIISIINATFHRHHPASHSTSPNPELFPDLSFELQSFPQKEEHWAILGPSSSGKTTLLEILQSKFLSFPPQSRSYPYLSSDEIDHKNHELRIPSRAIQYVGFGGERDASQGTRGAYLSARYESLKEATDWTVMNYLEGKTELNPSEEELAKQVDEKALKKVIKDLRLEELVDMPVANLSNGQTRRAKIAKAILERPEVLLLDEPFMGLDPPTLMSLSPLLHGLARANSPRLVLSLRPQDPIPDWITHLMYLNGSCQVAHKGHKAEVLRAIPRSLHEVGRTLTSTGILEPETATSTRVQRGDDLQPVSSSSGEPIIEMSGVRIAYGSKVVLGNWTQTISGTSKPGLHWTVLPGQRWGILGPNGSGKTTLLSLICSDHPQTYSQPVKLFGRSRLPEKGKRGISIFDIQARIGHSSPEIHHHIPKGLTLRQVLENAWSETFLSPPSLTRKDHMAIETCLRVFEPQLRPGYSALKVKNSRKHAGNARLVSWASDVLFRELPFSSQRVALFLRAIVKKPDLVILDEAFSGMDEKVRDKCMLFLAYGQTKHFRIDRQTGKRTTEWSRAWKEGEVVVSGLEPRQALLCISHVREEVPGCVREWMCLPEANTGEPVRMGRLSGPLDGDSGRWKEIWGI